MPTPAGTTPTSGALQRRRGMRRSNSDLYLDVLDPSHRAVTPEPQPGSQPLPRLPAVDHVARLSVPWAMRHEAPGLGLECAAALSSRYLWRKVEHAARVTLLSMLPCALLVFATATEDFFRAGSLSYTIAIIVGRRSVGEGIAMFKGVARSVLVATPLSVIAIAARAHETPYAFVPVCFLLFFLIGAVATGFTRKLALVLVAVSLATAFNNNDPSNDVRTPVYTLRVAVDVMVGALWGLVSVALPIPRLATAEAEAALARALCNTGVAYKGLTHNFWAETNLQRRVSIVRIRTLRSAVDADLLEAQQRLLTARYEPFMRRRVNLVRNKLALARRLLGMLDALLDTLGVISDEPGLIDGCPSQQDIFAPRLTAPCEKLGLAMDTCLAAVGAADVDAVPEPDRQFLEDTWADVDRAFYDARKFAFLDSGTPAPTVMSESYRLMGYFTFCLRAAVEAISTESVRPPAYDCWARLRLVAKANARPLVETVEELRLLCTRRSAGDLQRLKDSVKVAVAMCATSGIFYALEDEVKTAGAVIVAFISASDTGEAMHGSLQRMLGTLFGAVIGIFAGSEADTRADYIIALVVLVFVCSFFGTGKRYGTAAFYANFVVTAMLVPGQTLEGAMKRTQEHVVGGIVYFVVMNAVWACAPSAILRAKVDDSLHSLRTASCALIGLFGRTVAVSDTHCTAPGPASGLAAYAEQTDDGCSPIAALSPEPSRCATPGPALDPPPHGPTTRLMAKGGPAPSVLPSEIRTALGGLQRSVAESFALLPMVDLEPALRAAPYPVESARRLVVAQRRLLSIAETFRMAWDTLYTRADPTTAVYVAGVVQHLAAPAALLAAEVSELLDIVAVALADCHAPLGPVLVDRCLRVRDLATAMSDEQSRQFLSLVVRMRNPVPGGPSLDHVDQLPPPLLSSEVAFAFHAQMRCVTSFAGELWKLFLEAEDLRHYNATQAA